MTEEKELPLEAPEQMELCKCKRCRIKRFRMRQAFILPTKPVARIVGKHEYIRLDEVNDRYWTYTAHDFEVSPVDEHQTCKVCNFSISKEDIVNGHSSYCKQVSNPSTLDLNLSALKTCGRKGTFNGKRMEWLDHQNDGLTDVKGVSIYD
jgi:hypothetical protein